MENKFKALLKSRKFWAAVASLGVIALKGFLPNFPFSEEQVSLAVGTMVAFILGTGLEDARAR